MAPASLQTQVHDVAAEVAAALQSYSGRTIQLMTPWKVMPDATSVVVISQYELNMTFGHNTITNTLGVSIVLGIPSKD
jgi:hypothetical protein